MEQPRTLRNPVPAGLAWSTAPVCAVMLLCLLSSCVVGAGGSIGLYADSRGDVGAALVGHYNLLGFRLTDAPDTRPAAIPVFGVEPGVALSFRKPVWQMRMGVPIAATWDNTEDDFGVRISPQFVMARTMNYADGTARDAYGGGLAGAWLKHLATDSEQYDGPDAFRIHRLGPVLNVTVLRDEAGWLGSLFLGLMYDFEAYVASGR